MAAGKSLCLMKAPALARRRYTMQQSAYGVVMLRVAPMDTMALAFGL
jgi:hypothetical protein